VNLPRIAPLPDGPVTDSVTLAVYAMFGTDSTLSTYPDGSSQQLIQHPLVRNLLKVAKLGIHVSALIDRVGEPTYLVEIPAGRPSRLCVVSAWKQDMASPHTLAGFLHRVHHRNPKSAIVLAMEGHGAGFMPDIDRTKLTARAITRDGALPWRIDGPSSPALPEISPMLPEISPMLPEISPMLPSNHMPLSTFGFADGLRRAQAMCVPKLAVVHLNNCFNMAVEVAHTIAPYAEYATGYMNYNFFTAGDSYPAVFARLLNPGTHKAADLAKWFADENKRFLNAKGNHPTTGSVVPLARMHDVAERVDDLSDALLAPLRSLAGTDRSKLVDKIEAAITRAQQYDTIDSGSFGLETPDHLTDLYSLATELDHADFDPHPPVRATAQALQTALKGLKHYGDNDFPWVDVSQRWNFTRPDLAMSIFLPDPLRKGIFDWRWPFYQNVNPDPSQPRVQPNIIEFLQVTDWVDFLKEYHRDTKLQGFTTARIPDFPVFNAKFEPPKDRPQPNDTPTTPPRNTPTQQTPMQQTPRRYT
jgi:hypothetical protein